MAEHTPTPWKVVEIHNQYLGVAEVDENGFGVFTMNFECERDKANAALIVRSVNCHAELVDFLKSQLEVITFHDHEDVENRLIDLLARARGDSNV